jgi:hypothetical protein
MIKETDPTGEERLILQEKRDGFHRREEADPTEQERLILQNRRD